MEPTCIHHIEFGVQDGVKEVERFTSQYHFRLVGTRATSVAKQWVLKSHEVFFLITELTQDAPEVLKVNEPYVHPWVFPTKEAGVIHEIDHDEDCIKPNTDVTAASVSLNKGTPVKPADSAVKPLGDSVFNVALRVTNIDGCVARLSLNNVQIIKPLQTTKDERGSARVCTIKSCVGNVVHTLVDDSLYSGVFLPGFEDVKDSRVDDTHDEFRGVDDLDGDVGVTADEGVNDAKVNGSSISKSISSDLHHVDHVTFCTDPGSSYRVMDWYKRCFGMRRFFVNRDENEEEGFVIKGKDIGMRLKAFEYWKCAETGLATEEKAAGSVKFVIAEALPNQGPNQVDLYLANHGGPGVQHVGLHTGDIIGAVGNLQGRGVQFNEAPYTYYTEVGRLKEMVAMGMDVDQLQKNGILVDTEQDDAGDKITKDDATEPTPQHSSVRYLMQKFTRPLFDTDTFFLEVIQRGGATGFGSGNITALWRSVQAYLREKGIEQNQPESQKTTSN